MKKKKKKKKKHAHDQNVEQTANGISIKPPKFPMKFKEFLRRAFGGRHYSERLHFFRKFLETDYCTKYVDPEKTAAEIIGDLGRSGVQSTTYNYFISEIKEWRPRNRLQQRKDAAKKRWAKEKLKKSLGGDKNQTK